MTESIPPLAAALIAAPLWAVAIYKTWIAPLSPERTRSVTPGSTGCEGKTNPGQHRHHTRDQAGE